MGTSAAPAVEAEVQSQEVMFEGRVKKATEEIRKELIKQNDIQLKQAIDDFKKQFEPPTKEEIQTLLDQEYLEFTINVRMEGTELPRAFVIKELPQAVEKKFYNRLKTSVVNLVSELEAAKMTQTANGEKGASQTINLGDPDMFKNVLSVMNSFGPLLDVLVYAATLSLNPYGDEKEITEQWIAEHLSSTRILKIVSAQAECNRMRDFFSLVSRELNPPTTQKNPSIRR